MKCVAIAAMSQNEIIGVDGQIPWHCKEDLKLFKKLTMGKAILMGRKTYESVGALSGRETIVLSRTMPRSSLCHVIRSLDDLPNVTNKEIMIAGGEEIYRLCFQSNLIDTVILSHIDTNVNYNEGSKVARFPTNYLYGFESVNQVLKVESDKYNQFSFTTYKYQR